jgi:arsenite/tail-anchored protein-transporting ATPase
VIEALENMLKKLRAIKKLLCDTRLTTVRLVMNPEKMVINESKRALTYLNMYGLLVDAVIINRVLAPNSGYLEDWRQRQQQYLAEVSASFAPLPIQTAPQYANEVIGARELNRLAEDLYGSLDPSTIMFHHSVFEIRKKQDEYLLRMRLPLLDKQKLRIRNTGSEIVLQIDNQRRIISLPSAMGGYRPSRANYQDNYLVINFQKAKPSENATTEVETEEVQATVVEPLN